LIAGGSALTDAAIRVPDLENLSGKQRRQPPTYVPNRNMLFLSLAAAYAEARGIRDVFYGAQAQDEYGYWDCTVDFVNRINHILRLNRGKAVTVHAPFALMKKADVLKIGLELGVDYRHTWSCYRGGKKPCGTCPTCVSDGTHSGRLGLRMSWPGDRVDRFAGRGDSEGSYLLAAPHRARCCSCSEASGRAYVRRLQSERLWTRLFWFSCARKTQRKTGRLNHAQYGADRRSMGRRGKGRSLTC